MCQPQICVLNETIDSENYVLGSKLDNDVERFEVTDNKNVENLPGHIGATFPNLKSFFVNGCKLNIIRDFYFEGMWNLESLSLIDSKVAIIEPRAFADLVNVVSLEMQGNLIETLDQFFFRSMTELETIDLSNNKIANIVPLTFANLVKVKSLNMQGNSIVTLDEELFQTMSKLEALDLSRNQIQLLSPSTLAIPDSNIQLIDLTGNVCIDGRYNSNNGYELEPDLIGNCTQGEIDIYWQYMYIHAFHCSFNKSFLRI